MPIGDYPRHGEDYPTQDGIHVPERPQERERSQAILSQRKGRNHQD